MKWLGGGNRATQDMAKRKTAEQWRTFLRWLARTGNARLAARHAGMNVAAAYDKRIADDSFAAKWAGAVEKARAKPPSRKASAGKGPDLVLRRTKDGDKLVAVGPGRWSAKIEAAFRATLRRTGCVRAAVRACGLSTAALYYRRNKYPEFAAAWAADEAFARERIPSLLSAATIASLDPEIEDEDLPRVDVAQAIAIARLKCGPGAAGGGDAVPEPPIEEVRASIMRKLDAIEAHERKQGATKEDGDGDGGSAPGEE